MVSVWIEDQLLNDTPIIRGLKEVIEKDDKLNSWVKSFDDTELVFWGDGYNILKALKDANGYNYRATIRINVTPDGGLLGAGDSILGYIYLTDIEIDHTERNITVPLVELHFEGLLQQNQKVQAYLLTTATSINGPTNNIAAFAGTRLGLKLFDSGTGVHDANARYGVEISSALQFIIKYITDNQMDYQDNYFSTEWADVQFCLIKGRELRTYTHDQAERPLASFDEIITNLYKLFNVWWYIDYTTETPVFVLDKYDTIFNDPASVQVDILSIKNLKEKFNQDSFFTDIEIGTKVYILPPDGTTDYLPFYNGFTHHKEVFHGKNNTMNNNTLDLVSDWITDHNVITKIYNTPTLTDYDDNLFLIECENAGFLDDPALAYDYGLSAVATERRYNYNLLNYERLKRFQLPVDVGFDIDVTGDNFEAEISADTALPINLTTVPIEFDTEITDPNGNYSPVTFRYTAPADGNYGFTVNIQALIENFNNVGGTNVVTLRFYHRYSTGAVKNNVLKEFTINGNSGAEGIALTFNRNLLMITNETVEVGVQTLAVPGLYDISILADGTYFKTEYTANEGGLVVGETQINEYFGSELSFNRNIELSKWKQLKNTPVCDIKVTVQDGRQAICKLKKASREILTGETEFELITKTSKIGL